MTGNLGRSPDVDGRGQPWLPITVLNLVLQSLGVSTNELSEARQHGRIAIYKFWNGGDDPFRLNASQEDPVAVKNQSSRSDFWNAGLIKNLSSFRQFG
ncbi:MAG: hypothetical protein BGO01_14315 [Armatimonadetes bacterium 55-13]|nr:MAG: hypothetical protein BGO01_14315 [Armatimonadetes bacterium 55-13]